MGVAARQAAALAMVQQAAAALTERHHGLAGVESVRPAGVGAHRAAAARAAVHGRLGALLVAVGAHELRGPYPRPLRLNIS
jgi:hypothetical protein